MRQISNYASRLITLLKVEGNAERECAGQILLLDVFRPDQPSPTVSSAARKLAAIMLSIEVAIARADDFGPENQTTESGADECKADLQKQAIEFSQSAILLLLDGGTNLEFWRRDFVSDAETLKQLRVGKLIRLLMPMAKQWIRGKDARHELQGRSRILRIAEDAVLRQALRAAVMITLTPELFLQGHSDGRAFRGLATLIPGYFHPMIADSASLKRFLCRKIISAARSDIADPSTLSKRESARDRMRKCREMRRDRPPARLRRKPEMKIEDVPDFTSSEAEPDLLTAIDAKPGPEAAIYHEFVALGPEGKAVVLNRLTVGPHAKGRKPKRLEWFSLRAFARRIACKVTLLQVLKRRLERKLLAIPGK